MSVAGRISSLEQHVSLLRAMLESWRFPSGCWCRKGKWPIALDGHDEQCRQIQEALESTKAVVRPAGIEPAS